MTEAEARQIRRNTYAMCAAFVAIVIGWALWRGEGEGILVRGAFYGVVALLEYRSYTVIISGIDYFPVDKVEKFFTFWGFGVLTVAIITSISLGPLGAFLFIAMMLVGRIVALEFRLRRNVDPSRMFIRTSRGLAALPREDDLIYMVEIVGGAARHHHLPVQSRIDLQEDLDHPSGEQIAARLRRQYEQKHQKLIVDPSAADYIEVESQRDGGK